MRLYHIIPALLSISTALSSYQSPQQSARETTDSQETRQLLFEEQFDKLDSTKWVMEIAPAPASSVYVKDGKLWMDTYGGVTVWLNHQLEGNIEIEYERTVVLDSGANDRVSDLNQFWMATDPNRDSLFSRSGIFEEYDSLSLYYVGMGGNTNTTTRFRKYEGTGEKPLLYERDDQLLEANRTYHIRTVVKDGTTSFWVDGELVFSHEDPEPLTKGYFGFRSTYSRHSIDALKIYQIE
ncbi:LamG domain-containing protein [Parapedobacter tibetensis]|uniref:LamG domain-containing protein n=1 Tax=Parapedobacter tibetensis TaxID=2972951 RepID=UPI00214D2817|nr:LamG domain-containing protein [Parapedobacter tibetensis]